MNFWEQFILGSILSILHALKIDPTRVPLLTSILTDVYNGIAELEGWPTAPVAAPAPVPAPAVPSPTVSK